MSSSSPPVIVSMTTIQARNGTLAHVLVSLAAQSLAPDFIRIYATPGCQRPTALYGADWIAGVFDLGPITKLSAVRDLALPDDAIVVTCDDDQAYEPKWLEKLVAAAKRRPDCAVGFSGWNTRGFFTDRDYYEWVHRDAHADVLEGFAGVAYRRGFFDDDVFDVPDAYRYVDDVWISAYLARRGVERRVVGGGRMGASAPSDHVGLHTRKDFVAMNRAASRALFAPESAAPKLSILIPSLRSRLSSLMTLLANLDSQPRRNDVEVLVAIDSGQVPTGVKRDRLVTAARGDYVVFVEDDDTVAQDYIPKTLRALEERPGTLGLGHAVRRDHVPEATPEIPPASSPRLTVCVPSVTDRGPLLARLLTCVLEQPRADEVEVLVIIDAPRKRTTGDKRNRLVAQASGAYVCHVDDDDLVAPEYVGAILSAVDQAPADAVLIRGQRRVLPDGGTLAFDFGCAPNVDGAVAEDGALWRQIGHLCPVRAEIAKAVPFPDLTVGEDLKWGHAVASRIKTKVRAGRPGQVLYYYEFSPHKNAKIPMQESPPRILSPRRAARKAEREAQRAQRVPMSDSFNHEAIFTPQYTDCSGPGSALSSTVPYREFLAAFVREHGVRSILDLGCGDFEVMSHVDIGETSYLGVDVIVERISRNVRKANVMKLHRHHFAVGDARTWPISNFDLVICKDVVQHWSNAEVTAWLARLAFARVKYALVTNCNYGPTVNRDIATGGWRAVDLTKPPFGVGEVVFTWEFGGATKDVVLVESWRRRSRQ